ncbi:MAG TPA: hypothetical protein DIU15_09810 [Deltaproteobacteria bacterium]|nr:hypothetical protein [Deltaproteobacteria bacterium]
MRPVEVNLSPFGPFLPGDSPPSDGEFARQWFTLFEEGARQIVFQRGIDRNELRELLHILSADAEDGEDIVTALWRKELKHVQVFVARVLIRGVDLGEDKSASLQEQYGRWKSMLHSGAKLRQGVDAVQLSPDDFRILALDEDGFDWCRLSTEVSAELREERKKPKLAASVDREIRDLDRFLDLAVALEEDADATILNVMAGMTRMGMVHELNRMICAVAAHSEFQGRSLQALLEDPEALNALVPLVESEPSAFHDSLAAIADINAEAAEKLLENVEAAEASEESGEFVATPDTAPMHFFSSRLMSSDPAEALEAVESLVALGTDEAFLLALGGYESPHAEVRRAVLKRLFAKYDPTLGHMIPTILQDPHKANRILTLSFIAEQGSNKLLREVMALMKHRDFARRDHDERIAFVRTLGRHSRLPVITRFLCKLLLGFRLFSGKTTIEFQSEVAKFVVGSPSQEAEETVRKVLASWGVPAEIKQVIRAEQVRQSLGDTDVLSGRDMLGSVGGDTPGDLTAQADPGDGADGESDVEDGSEETST